MTCRVEGRVLGFIGFKSQNVQPNSPQSISLTLESQALDPGSRNPTSKIPPKTRNLNL